MKILFISDFINPFEPTYGGAQRSNLFLNALCQFGEVDVVVFQDNIVSNIPNCKVVYSKKNDSVFNISRRQKLTDIVRFTKITSYFHVVPEMEKVVDKVIAEKHYDYIAVRYIPEACKCGLVKYASRLIIDVDDHPKDVLKSQAKRARTIPNKIYLTIMSWLVSVAIQRLIQQIYIDFFSNQDQVPFRQNTFYLPNIPFYEKSIDYVSFETSLPIILFVGRLDHYPNYLGLTHFIKKVLPIVKQKIPNVELRIVGYNGGGEEAKIYQHMWEQTSGVKVVGFVQDVIEEYKRCRATISPIYQGAGTNIKILESLQFKRACVTTLCGMRGFTKYFIKGKDILVANTEDEYASNVIQLLSNEKFNHNIAKNGHEQVVTHYSKQAFFNIVQDAIICKKY